MDKIPVSFQYKGKDYKGHLSKVSGAASTGLWHLMIDHYYYGQLNLTHKGWRFTSQTGELEDLSEFFGEVVMAWYQ